jgi:hypothetical protein
MISSRVGVTGFGLDDRSFDSSQQTELLNNRPVHTVTYRPIATQRLGKHIPAGVNVRDNRMSIAGQRHGKHTSSKI